MSDSPRRLLPPPEWYKKDRVDIDPEPTGKKEEAETFENERKELGNQSLRQDICERRLYSGRAYRLTLRWICFIVVVTFIQQFMSIWQVGLLEKVLLPL